MIVKDIHSLRKFIKNSTDNQNKDENFIGYSHPVGSDDSSTIARGFFAVYHSQSPRITERLSTVLNMAQDSQAIYEFVQNAVDCDSTAFFMYYDEEYFIALNNGRPFDLAGIRAILNFAQSTKNISEEDNIGKFGVGFKLIHRMVGAGNGIHELTNEYTGPLLFSWSNRAQLQELLKTNNSADFQKDSDVDWNSANSPWFFKILMTCVPLLPSAIEGKIRDNNYVERNDLFTEQEYQKFHLFLTTFWKKNEEKLKNENLDQGSLFFLKLGHDKQKRLDEDFDYFKRGIQYSLRFVSNLMNRKGLSHVYFKDEAPIIQGQADIELEPAIVLKSNDPEFEKIRINLDDYDKDRNISFVFGFQEFGKNNEYGGLTSAPNFYKFFPMGKEECGLNFILHCNVFQIDTSRREFVQKDPLNQFLLTYFVKTFIKRLEDYKTTKPERFRQIFLAILFSNDIPRGNINAERKWVYELLYQPLLNYLSLNIPISIENQYQPSSNVIIKNTVLDVTLADLGISNRSWFYWGLHSAKGPDVIVKATKLKMSNWGISELIRFSEIDAFKKWVSSLDEIQQQNFSDEFTHCLSTNQPDDFWHKVISIPELIDIVKGFASPPSKIRYINNVQKIYLETTKEYTEEHYEYKILHLVKEVALAGKDLETFRSKIYIKDESGETFPLADVRENDKIKFTFDNHDYELSAADVLPEFQTKSGLLGGLIKQFEEKDLLLTKLLGLGNPKQPAQIYQLIQTKYQKLKTVHQFVFLGYYSELLKNDLLKLFDLEELDKGGILQCYFENNYHLSINYAGKYLVPDSKTKVISEQWSIPSESIGESIESWVNRDDKENRIAFLSKKLQVNSENSDIVKIRKSIINGEEVEYQNIIDSASKHILLLINTLHLIESKKQKIDAVIHGKTLKSIFETSYKLVPLIVGEPVAFVENVSEDKITSYSIRPLSNDVLLYDAKNSNLSEFGLSLADIIINEKFAQRSILDADLYSTEILKKANTHKLNVSIQPDWSKIVIESWPYPMDFFVHWMETSLLNFAFLTDEIPQLIVFQDEILKEIRLDKYCYEESSKCHFISLQPSLDDIESAEIIVDAICNLGDNIINEKQKGDLVKAHQKWKDGEEEDVAQFSKKRIKESVAYSFEWLKHVFDWEYYTVVRKKKAHTITFDKVVMQGGVLLLSECSDETIPSRIEFITEPLVLKLKTGRNFKTIKCKVIRYGEFELKVLPVTDAEELYLTSIKDFRKFRAMLELPEGDMLMDNLRENLFGKGRVVTNSGDMRKYFAERIGQDQISFLFGPPGTGKTTRIALDLLMTLSNNEAENAPSKILVLTPTNKAADVVIERMVSLIFDVEKLSAAASGYFNAEEIEKLIAWSKDQVSSGAYKKFLIRMGNSDSEILNRHGLIFDKQNSEDIPESFVVCTTIHRFGFDNIGGTSLKNMEMGWTHLIMDESSMISLPHAVLALIQFSSVKTSFKGSGLSSRIVVSGDPFQLKAVGQTPNYIDESNGYLGWSTENVYSLFQLDNFNLDCSLVGNFSVNKLMTQYRSVPEIGQLFSAYKYDGLLKHHQISNETGIKLGGELLKNIVPVSFPVFNKKEDEDDIFIIQTYGEYSAYQIYSIVLACELAFRLKTENPTKSIGIISPFGTQARLLKEISAVFDERFPGFSFNASTVHRYQGDEDEIIILLMIPSNTRPATFSHFNNPNLINVGISRAKECLILMQPSSLEVNTEIGTKLMPISPVKKFISGIDLEKMIFKGDVENNEDNRSPFIHKMIEVKTFLPFNISDIVPFTESDKEYLFFAGNRNVNVIMNLKRKLKNILI